MKGVIMARIIPIRTGTGVMAIKVRAYELMQERFGSDESLWPSRKSIAEALDVNSATVTAWLRGNIRRTELETIEKWCEYFSCEVSDLLVRERDTA
jgi:DNA-binding Xre family transcriptional regulator